MSNTQNLKGKKIAILATNGFEQSELIQELGIMVSWEAKSINRGALIAWEFHDLKHIFKVSSLLSKLIFCVHSLISIGQEDNRIACMLVSLLNPVQDIIDTANKIGLTGNILLFDLL